MYMLLKRTCTRINASNHGDKVTEHEKRFIDTAKVFQLLDRYCRK